MRRSKVLWLCSASEEGGPIFTPQQDNQDKLCFFYSNTIFLSPQASCQAAAPAIAGLFKPFKAKMPLPVV
jgi:hypothetical protein